MRSAHSYDVESVATICVLFCLTSFYVYLLLSPKQPRVPTNKNFVIARDSKYRFDALLKRMAEYESEGNNLQSFWDDKNLLDDPKEGGFNDKEWGGGKQKEDDFLLDVGFNNLQETEEEEEPEVIIPSKNYYCPVYVGGDNSDQQLLTIRSEMNYKYMWMHGNEHTWMTATATFDTPVHRKSFKITPVKVADGKCDNGGWVLLQESDMNMYIMMVRPSDKADQFVEDEWVIRTGTSSKEDALLDQQYHFLLEDEGYILNRANMAFITVMPQSEYSAKGHSGGWNRNRPAGREYGSMLRFSTVNASEVAAAVVQSEQDEIDAKNEDQKRIAMINAFPLSTEMRVVSYGLYGTNPKYTTGAIRNAELVKVYFPGWTCRFYVTQDVPTEVRDKLLSLGSEVLDIPTGKGYASGMFWRFLVASDPTVDRYIIRDADSRLNSRERLAVEEWIDSKYPVHVMRDHVNHCIVMNGGMWGGTKDAVPMMKEMVESWSSRDEYMADLYFLEEQVWPKVYNSHFAHDSYCCDRFPNTKPFPSKRDMTYQHVGQVFDSEDHYRLSDIDGFIRGVPVPAMCRHNENWIYG